MKKTLLIILILTCSNLLFAAFGSNKTDGDYISLSGEVHKVGKTLFNMKVDGELVDVEFDSIDGESSLELIKSGQEVVVYGRMDKEAEGSAKIEAGSVLIESSNQRIYADSNDEESYPLSSATMKIRLNELVDLEGEVTKVNERDIIIDTGDREIAVRTDLVDDEFSSETFTKGDKISVNGKVGTSLYNGKQLVAKKVKKI